MCREDVNQSIPTIIERVDMWLIVPRAYASLQPFKKHSAARSTGAPSSSREREHVAVFSE
jgi:hypothetical protein